MVPGDPGPAGSVIWPLGRLRAGELERRAARAAGSLSSLRDRPLREALLRLNGAEENALSFIQLVRPVHWILVDRYPEPLPRTVDEIACDADRMRTSRAFRNHLVSDLARYDGQIKWEEDVIEALRDVRLRLDKRLSIDHSTESST